MTGLDRPLEPLTALRGFRDPLHGAMRRRQDALFELAHAILTAGAVPSYVRPSLVPARRRGWVTRHAALAKGQIDEGDARELLARYPSAEDRPAVYAVDVSP